MLGMLFTGAVPGDVAAEAPAVAAEARAAAPAHAADAVVLVHGLQWIRDTLKPAEEALTAAGYRVLRFRYDSRKPLHPDALAKALGDFIRSERPANGRPLHFVCHSMGCIVVRCFLSRERPERLGRVVMLAPPNKGSELADLVAHSRLLQSIFGKGAVALQCGEGLPAKLPAPDYDPGVIMGTRSDVPLLSAFLEGADDGLLTVECGRLPGMGDFVTVAASHTGMTADARTLRQVEVFLRTGKFDHPAAASRSVLETAPAASPTASSGREKRSAARWFNAMLSRLQRR